jgi:hypothetical protein
MTVDADNIKCTGYNSTYPKVGVSSSKDSFVVNGTLVFQIKFCGKSPALRVAANRYGPFLNDNANRYRQTNEFT